MRIILLMLGIEISVFANHFENNTQPIRIIGSASVYHFISEISERFISEHNMQQPIIESTGTGAGFSAFCLPYGSNSPDIVNASRQIKPSETKRCAANGILYKGKILGTDAIILVTHHTSTENGSFANITAEEIFLASSKFVPKNGQLVLNFYKYWNEISTDLPNIEIAIYSPPSSSGTLDSFVDLIIMPICTTKKEFSTDAEKCGLLRRDRHFIETIENDNFRIHKISMKRGGIAIISNAYYKHSANDLSVINIDGNSSRDENDYIASRKFYMYMNTASKKPHVKDFFDFAKI